MEILCVTHADFESPGVIEKWAFDRHYRFKIARPYQGESISDENNFDFLIVMGGPQSPLRPQEFPYLSSEISLIKAALSEHKKIFGFCLGAQLIGEALGAKTERSPEKEIGVYPITVTKEGMNDPLFRGLPNSFPVIHWHSDMPGLTKDSTVLASSRGCPRQIVRYRSNVYGFQCHLEIEHNGIKTMIEAVPEDLTPSKFTQTSEEMLNQNYSSMNNLMTILLDRFIGFTV